MSRIYPLSLFVDFRAFHRALFLGHPYEPDVRSRWVLSPDPEPAREAWGTYYATCVGYITSLHSQFIAVLSVQGALAIGVLAAKPVLDKLGSLSAALSWGVPAAELGLTVVAMKLFRQHCVVCWMLARVEQEELGLPLWAGMKGLLGTAGNRLFTSPAIYVLSLIYGLLLAVWLGLFALRGGL